MLTNSLIFAFAKKNSLIFIRSLFFFLVSFRNEDQIYVHVFVMK